MMNEKDRYSGEPKRLYDFMGKFLVHCPKCKGRALVNVPYFLEYKNAILVCDSCHFSEKANSRIRYVLAGKVKCVHCLQALDLTMEGRKKILKYINITCNACKKTNRVGENWSEIILKYQKNGIIDPAFGLPLWYSDTVKGNEIWAYNQDHLNEIKLYVQSKLRERATDRFKMTMVEKLPDFIKLAKNRDVVLKAIEKMQAKCL